MYVNPNFKSKKELKEAVANGEEVTVFRPGLGPDVAQYTGDLTVEGPHYPQPHTWYAIVHCESGKVTKVVK